MPSSNLTRACCFLLSFLSASNVGRLAHADDAERSIVASQETRERVQLLMKAMIASREAMQSGSYEATVVRSATEHPAYGKIQIKAEMTGAFDFASGRVRFDYQETPRRPGTSGRFIRTPQEAWLYQEHQSGKNPQITHLPPDELPEGTLFRVVDIRTIGWNLVQEFDRGTAFEDLVNIYEKEPTVVLGLQENEDGTVRIDFREGRRGNVKRSLWIDVSRSLPVRVEMRYWDLEDEEWGPVKSSSKTEWERRSDVWVPKTYHAQHVNRNRDGTTWTENVDVNFSWISINEPVDDVLFDPIKGLNPKEGTDVIDVRQGHPVLERTIE